MAVFIPVHETFQQTIQGEGYWSGTAVDFIRLAGCPVRCPWCDTGYSDGGKFTPRIHKSVDALVGETVSNRVVISGGEPFIHSELPYLVDALNVVGKSVHIETSGAYWQFTNAEWVTLSPKHHVSSRYPVKQDAWDNCNEIKIVIKDGSEVEFYKSMISEYGNSKPVYLQPEWESLQASLPVCLGLIKANQHFKLSLQTHKFIGVQ